MSVGPRPASSEDRLLLSQAIERAELAAAERDAAYKLLGKICGMVTAIGWYTTAECAAELPKAQAMLSEARALLERSGKVGK